MVQNMGYFVLTCATVQLDTHQLSKFKAEKICPTKMQVGKSLHTEIPNKRVFSKQYEEWKKKHKKGFLRDQNKVLLKNAQSMDAERQTRSSLICQPGGWSCGVVHVMNQRDGQETHVKD